MAKLSAAHRPHDPKLFGSQTILGKLMEHLALAVRDRLDNRQTQSPTSESCNPSSEPQQKTPRAH